MIWVFIALSTVGFVGAGIDRFGIPQDLTVEPYGAVLISNDIARVSNAHLDSGIEKSRSGMIGIRGTAPVGEHWEAGLDYGFSRFEVQERGGGYTQTYEIRSHAVLAEARRLWELEGADLYAIAGAGTFVLATREPRYGCEPPRCPGESVESHALALSDVAPPNPETEHDMAFLLGAGARRRLTGPVEVMAEVRDLLHLCRGDHNFDGASDVLCDRSTTLHYWQLTAGLRVGL